MEDVLAVYTRPRDPDRPLVCLDETSKQLIAETRLPIPMKAGRPARFDYEYERNGTANLFMMFAPLEGWRHVKVTDRHTAVDYAHVLKELVDIHFANAKTIVLVQDNLNIHSKASLYEAFPAAEARRLVERFEWHYTPKHGSWLDLAESELGIGRDLRWPSGLPRNPANLLPMTTNSVLSDGLHTRNGRRHIVCCNRTRGWRRSCEASRNGLSGCRRSASPRLAAPLRRRRPNNPRSSGRKSRLRKLTCPPVIISGSSVISLMDRATGRNEIGVSRGADGPPSKQESKNMAYIYLIIAAIITEVIGTLALKASDGFSKFQPSAIVVAGYATAFFFLSRTLRTMPVGIAYAIWAGSGTALIVLVGAMLFKQSPDTDALIGIALILAGIVVINLGSSEISAHSG